MRPSLAPIHPALPQGARVGAYETTGVLRGEPSGLRWLLSLVVLSMWADMTRGFMT